MMYRSGMISLALSLFLACLTLVLVTRSLVLAAMASACIGSVVIVFLGVMQLMGWTLGARWALPDTRLASITVSCLRVMHPCHAPVLPQ